MCGIIGYVGNQKTLPVLIEGLKRLEYRGYDSAGVALTDAGNIFITRSEGKIAELEKKLVNKEQDSVSGIAHTRWATHGIPSEANAHPQTDCQEEIAVVHNGIVENYEELKTGLIKNGHQFNSETDTEVLAHLIEEAYQEGVPLEKAVTCALVGESGRRVIGTYGLVVTSKREPGKLVAARLGSPLVLGVGPDGSHFIASDISAFLEHTDQVVYLEDGDIVVIEADRHKVIHQENGSALRCINKIDWDLAQIQKGGYDHFMLKEIMEQPASIARTITGRLLGKEGRVRLGGIERAQQKEYQKKLINLESIDKIDLLACGTSWHAGLIGSFIFERMLGIPCSAQYASEYRYRQPVIDDKTLAIAISQSGETTDTLEALREAKKKGAVPFGIVNVVGSTIARETGIGIYTHAGPEIGVASTKAFTSQVVTLLLLALYWGRNRNNLTAHRAKEIIKALQQLPDQAKSILDNHQKVKELAKKFKDFHNFLYLGRGYNYPTALEGALKLKEISYIHAEGYPAAEMKHGPIALIDPRMPVVFIAPKDNEGPTYEKILSNIEEVKARKGTVIAVATEGDKLIADKVDDVIYIPSTEAMLTPILAVIPLQLLAYYIAVSRGCDVDQPRNLAKSVTVE
ncbi:MAG: glutamine--fructose-6-phosphate transaminase (isomerizing) [Patescibacteria group bacterium]